MALKCINAEGVEESIQADGDGTAGNPWVMRRKIDTITAGASLDLGAKADSAATDDTSAFSVIAILKRILARWTTLLAALPASLGQKTMTNSLPVVIASNQTSIPVDIGSASVTIGSEVTVDQGDAGASAWAVKAADGDDATFGAKADAAAAGDSSTATYMALFKRLLGRVTTLIGLLPSALGAGGGLKVDGSGTALPVSDGGSTLSVDDGGSTLSIDDGAGSITVDGSVAVSGTVTVDTELPAAAALADGESNPTAPAVGSHLSAFNGATWDRVRVASKGYDMSAVAIGSIATVATPTSGKKIRVMSGSFSVSAASSVLFEDNAGGTTVFRTPKLLADTPYSFDLGGGYLLSAANNVLKATSSASANITGTIRACEE